MEKFYCICDKTDLDNTPEISKPIENLINLTLETAEDWINQNQTQDEKYVIMRHNDLEEIL